MRYREILNEMLWTEYMAGIDAAKRFPTALIHFSQVKLLEPHPDPSHSDPPGIYFYPIRWILDIDKIGLNQYATSYEYYTIAKIKPSANILNLRLLTTQQVINIARRNDWLDEYNEIKNNINVITDKRFLSKKQLKSPGGLMYAIMRYIASEQKTKTWMEMLHGFDGISDNGNGFIAEDEPSQVVVFQNKDIIVLEQGENTDNLLSIVADIIKQIAHDVNGTFFYKNDLPCVQAVIDGKPITMMVDYANYRVYLTYYDHGFLNVKKERIYGSSTGDKESYYRNFKYYLTSTSKKADSELEHNTYWNGTTILDFSRYFGLTLYQGRVENNEYTFILSDRGMAGSDLFFEFKIKPDGSGFVNIEFNFAKYEYKSRIILNDRITVENLIDKVKKNLRKIDKKYFPAINNLLGGNFK